MFIITIISDKCAKRYTKLTIGVKWGNQILINATLSYNIIKVERIGGTL